MMYPQSAYAKTSKKHHSRAIRCESNPVLGNHTLNPKLPMEQKIEFYHAIEDQTQNS